MAMTIHPYRPEDLESIVALLNAADAVYKIEDGTSVEETRELFSSPGFNPENNVFIAEDDGSEPSRRIIGYSYVRLKKDATESSFRTWYQVHPSMRGRGLEERLLAQQSARAEERLGECESANVYFDAFTNVVEAHCDFQCNCGIENAITLVIVAIAGTCDFQSNCGKTQNSNVSAEKVAHNCVAFSALIMDGPLIPV